MPTTRKTARVTPAQPVDGTVHRKPRQPEARPRSSTINHVHVDPAVWAEVQRLRLRNPWQRVRVVSATEVWLVP